MDFIEVIIGIVNVLFMLIIAGYTILYWKVNRATYRQNKLLIKQSELLTKQNELLRGIIQGLDCKNEA